MSEAKVVTIKVYRNGEKERNLVLHVQPGAELQGSQYKDGDGKPAMMQLQFRNGELEVPLELGRWLIDKGYAEKDRRLIQVAA